MSRGGRRKAAEKRNLQEGVVGGEQLRAGAVVGRDTRRDKKRRNDTAVVLNIDGSAEGDKVMDTRRALGHTVEG